MSDNNFKIPNNLQIIQPGETLLKGLKNSDSILNNPEIQKAMANIAQENTMHNIIQPPKTDFIIRNPHKKTESLLAETNVKLNEANMLNQELSKELTTLRKQLEESPVSKVGHKLTDILIGGLGGVVTAILLYIIAKCFGITF